MYYVRRIYTLCTAERHTKTWTLLHNPSRAQNRKTYIAKHCAVRRNEIRQHDATSFTCFSFSFVNYSFMRQLRWAPSLLDNNEILEVSDIYI